MEEKQHKTALVTGATGAIGRAIAMQLAREGFETILACRDGVRGEQAAAEIRRATGNARVRCEQADMGSLDSIRALAGRHQGPLHVLINNAAIAPRERLENSEGLELQFAVNILGYYRMIREFSEVLAASEGARVVNVASYWAGDLDLSDLQFRKRPYNNNTAYRQSKQANRMLTASFAELFANRGIAVNAVHPGDVNSTLSNDLGFGGSQSAEEGARTPLLLATTPVGLENTGKYFERMRETPCPFMQDRQAVKKLHFAAAEFHRQRQ